MPDTMWNHLFLTNSKFIIIYEMPLKKLTSFNLCYFVIISTHPTCSNTVNYPGTKLVGVAFKLKKRMKNSPLYAHVLYKTLNLVILCRCFTEDSNLKRLWRAIVLHHCRCHRHCLSSPKMNLRQVTNLCSRYNVKLDGLPISNTAQVLFRIVLCDGSL